MVPNAIEVSRRVSSARSWPIRVQRPELPKTSGPKHSLDLETIETMFSRPKLVSTLLRYFSACYAFLILLPFSSPAREQSGAPKPRVFLLDAEFIQSTRQRIWAGDKSFTPALEKLERDASATLEAEPFSVMEKKTLPPSGNKHDFMSQAPYYWPDPKSTDGLPYIRRDGERNPEIYQISDRRNLGRMGGAVETLSLAYYFTTNEA